MADKQVTLEDLARQEAEFLKKRDRAKQDFLEGQKALLKDVPERFFVLAKQVREGVRRFNSAAAIERPVSYVESAAVTVREPSLNGDYSFEIARQPNELQVALRNMVRAGKPDAYIIEGKGNVGVPPMVDRFLLRIDAVVKDGVVSYRAMCDYKKLDTHIDELGDRLVMVVVTGELARLWNTPPWVLTPQDNTSRR